MTRPMPGSSISSCVRTAVWSPRPSSRPGCRRTPRLALLHVHVLADFSGRGIGSALLRHAEALALAEGRTILQSYTEHPADFDPGGPGLVQPATGSGALPAAAPGVRFALRAGYRLEQVERFSTLALPPPATVLDALEHDALARAGETYELLHWTDRCPDALAGELAALMARMSTDVPSGGLNYEEETWDVARLRDLEDTWKQAGQTSLIAAARHRASGALAAYSVLQVSAGKPWLASQEDTLVAAGHRGHRLGMLVKILNLRRLRAAHPGPACHYLQCGRKRAHAGHQHRARLPPRRLRR